MRNLKLLSSDVNDTSVSGLQRFLVLDALAEWIFFATKAQVFSFSLKDNKIFNQTSINDGEIIAIENFLDDDILIVATTNGDIYEWRYREGSFDCIATMETGILCMSWSPDQDIMVLVTGNEKLVLMNRDLDPLTETELNPPEFGEAELITVGWGKKATQFHGKEGKPKPEDLKQKVADPILPWDDRMIRICWSEDGQYFVTSSVDPQTGSRKLRVRSREGSLFSTNDVVQGLEHSLDWKPNGNLIASSQRKPNKHEIIFFEKNGLTHGEFALPFQPKEMEVIEVCWNKSSEVLAVWLEELRECREDSNKKSRSYVQLWTRGNYHWYLKQELRLSDYGRAVSCLKWDAEIPLKLHIICSDGLYLIYTWHWTVSQSKDSCVAVIDGAKLLLTPFTKAVVPPPMSLRNITLQSPVNQVCFGHLSNHATVILADGTMQSLCIKEKEILIQQIEVICENAADWSVRLADHFSFMHLVHWIDNCFIAVSKDRKHNDVICLLSHSENNSVTIKSSDIARVDGKVHSIAVNPESSCVAIQMRDGEIFTCERDDDTFVVKPWITPLGSVLRFPSPCESMSVCTINHTDVLIGMTERFYLFIDEKQIAENCTSFAIHEEYLIYTTHAHTLRCLHLDNLLKWLLGSESSGLNLYESERKLERGSKIVSVLCQDTKVVLQMPRGNLETIHPRVLVVSFLKKLLDKMAYKKALNTMKRHRINLNLIYDHNPELFIKNVDTFVADVSSETDINLFLADLMEEDVTQSFYACCYDGKNSEYNIKNSKNGCKKVDIVCIAVREAIQRLGIDKLFLAFLTSYIKQTVPDLETVLIEMKKIKADKQRESATSFDRALKHILYMTDVEQLYNVALGLYDFDITLMVAEKSNKDPKEYLPFLNEMKSYEHDYGKFKIDCHLKRYRKALEHIFNCGESYFEEYLTFVLENEFYKEALELCSSNQENFKRVSFLYGSNLVKKKCYEEAGLVYSRVGFYQEALDSFVKCVKWKLALCEASKLQYSKEKICQLAKDMAEKLQEMKRWDEAAVLLEVYAEDYESAIVACIDGHLWEDSLRMIYRFDRKDLIETNLIPAIIEAFNHYQDTIADLSERFIHHKERLMVVRVLKEKQSSERIEDGYQDEGDNDLFSDASSVSAFSTVSASSKGSRMSGHSSKSRRKFKRKKYSLKEGSRYEDFALMESMAQIINTIDKLQESIGSLLKIMVLFSKHTEAPKLQTSFRDCLLLIKNSWSEIWMSNQKENEKQIAMGPSTTVNSIIADFQSTKQQGSNSNIEDLPPLTQPMLRNDVDWQLSVLL